MIGGSSFGGGEFVPPPSSSENNTKDIKITTANVSGAGVDSKLICLKTGDSANADSGEIKIETGLAPAGTRGLISLRDGTEGTIGYIWTSKDVTGGGEWKALGAIVGFMDTDFGNHVASAVAIDLGSNKIINVSDPTLAQDAATKNYVDNLAPPTGANKFLSNLNAVTAINRNLTFSGANSLWDITTPATVSAISSGLRLISGNVSGINTSSGHVRLISGDNTATGNSSSGNVYIESGSSTVRNTGTISILTGTTPDTSGAITIGTGNVTNLPAIGSGSGAINISTGDGNILSAGSNPIGDLTISTGIVGVNNASAGGDIFLKTGSSGSLNAGAGGTGKIDFKTGATAGPNNLSGSFSFSTGNSVSTSGKIEFITGNSSGAGSGDFRFIAGTASGLQGKIDFVSASEIDHNKIVSKAVVWESGLTASRPSGPVTGQRFFDTTLGLPIWYNGTNWINASGGIV